MADILDQLMYGLSDKTLNLNGAGQYLKRVHGPSIIDEMNPSRPAKKRVTPGLGKPTGKRAAGSKRNKKLKSVGFRPSDVAETRITDGIPGDHLARSVQIYNPMTKQYTGGPNATKAVVR